MWLFNRVMYIKWAFITYTPIAMTSTLLKTAVLEDLENEEARHVRRKQIAKREVCISVCYVKRRTYWICQSENFYMCESLMAAPSDVLS